MKRDDWMMLPPEATIISEISRPDPSRITPMDVGEESYTEEYGDLPSNSRTGAGGVDFFSSLGTERKKPPRPDRPDPDKVCVIYPFVGQKLTF